MHDNRFDQIAGLWDKDEQRVRMAENIAEEMIRNLELQKDHVLLDYGTGTGIIALKLQPYVKKVIAIDSSQGMLDTLSIKLTKNEITNTEILKGSVEDKTFHFPAVDVIVSSMVLHHIKDIKAAAKAFWDALKPNGQIAIADLDEDNGEFHADPNAAMHNGFNHAKLQNIFLNAGFKSIRFREAYTVKKQSAKGKESVFKIFLMLAQKNNDVLRAI
jgi:tRNA (cmo5U34)-methyltransferase